MTARGLSLPTGFVGRCLALASLLGLLGLGYLAVVAPVFDLYAEREAELAQRRMLEPRLRAAGEETPALRARLAELQATMQNRKIALDGGSDAIAAANLQSRVEELANAAGVAIGSTEGLAPESRGPFRRIGLRLAVAGEYESLLRLLGAIESTSPPLVVGELQIRSGLRLAGAANGSRIDAGFEVYGFRSGETPVASAQ